MHPSIKIVRPGIILALLTLLFGISLGVAFGVDEDAFQTYIANGIAAHPELHDGNSQDKIWRFVQRAHFHATGIGAFLVGLILLTAFSGLGAGLKRLTSILIGLGGLYPLAWFSIFLLAPGIGRDAAHEATITQALTYVGVGGLSLGLLILFIHLLFGTTSGEVPHEA